MPHPSKRKGNAGELEVAKALTEELGDVGLVSRTGYMQSGDSEQFDLFIPGVGLEIKRYAEIKKHHITSAWSQAFAALTTSELVGKVIPAVAYRADRQDWHFVIPEIITEGQGLEIWSDIEYSKTLYLEGFCHWWRKEIRPRIAQSSEGQVKH